jgi:hypothetical protein
VEATAEIPYNNGWLSGIGRLLSVVCWISIVLPKHNETRTLLTMKDLAAMDKKIGKVVLGWRVSEVVPFIIQNEAEYLRSREQIRSDAVATCAKNRRCHKKCETRTVEQKDG